MPEQSKVEKISNDIRKSFQSLISESLKVENPNFDTIRASVEILRHLNNVTQGLTGQSPSLGSTINNEIEDYEMSQGVQGTYPGVSMPSITHHQGAYLPGIKRTSTKDEFEKYLPILMKMQTESYNPPEKRAITLLNIADALETRGKKDLAERCRIMAERLLDDLTSSGKSCNSDARPITLPDDKE